MACSLFSLLLVFLFIANLSNARDLITEVCSRTRNPTLCYKTLGSDPRAPKSDLKGLGHISIEISASDTRTTYTYVMSLSKAGPDPELQTRYDICAENYNNAIYNIDEARQALDAGDIGTFRAKASAAFEGPATCEDVFKGPPLPPRQLQRANEKSKGLVSVVLAVGAILDGK